MATTSPYALRSDYVSDTPVSAADLNRRARVLSAQLPGALRASSLCEGVFPLWNPDEGLTAAELVTDLLSAALAALKVTVAGGQYNVTAGAANILHPSGALVYTQSAAVSAATGSDDPEYIHLQLKVPVDPLAPGAADGMSGSAPVLLVSDLESETGAILLADRTGGVLHDRRQFTAPVLLAIQFAALQAQFDALAAAVDPTSDGPTAAQFLALQNRVTAQGDEIADLYARLAAAANKDLDAPVDTDILADNQAIQEARLNALDPDGTAKAAISAVTANAGHGQNSSADFTPTTGDAHEMPFDLTTGRLG